MIQPYGRSMTDGFLIPGIVNGLVPFVEKRDMK